VVVRTGPCREVVRYAYGMVMGRRRSGKALVLRARRPGSVSLTGS